MTEYEKLSLAMLTQIAGNLNYLVMTSQNILTTVTGMANKDFLERNQDKSKAYFDMIDQLADAMKQKNDEAAKFQREIIDFIKRQ